MTSVLESKTLKFWLVLLAVGFLVIVFTTAMNYLGVQVPFVSDFFNLLGVGGGASTMRNIVSDGVMPRVETIQQAKFAAYQNQPGPTVVMPVVTPSSQGGQ